MKNKAPSISSHFVQVKHLVKNSFEMIERMCGRKEPIAGLSTGLIDLDNMTSGLQPADLIIVAGRPAMGKTSFYLNIAEHVSMEMKRPVGIFSLEMSREQLMLRLFISQAEVDVGRLMVGFLSDEDWTRIARAKDRLAEANLFIDDTSAISVMEMRAKAHRLKAQQGDPGLMIVDYLQLMGEYSSEEDRALMTLKLCRSLKTLATELNVPVMVIFQLNRAVEERPDKRPVLADLNHYGPIERVADVVLFVYRDAVYNETEDNRGEAEVIVAKQRNGPTGTVKLTFLDRFTKFVDREQRSDF